MKLEFPVEKTIKTRSSIRTYEEKPLDIKVKQQIKDYIAALSNPFSVEVKLQLLETASSNEKLGTYGVIKGARDYIGATVSEVDLNLEAVGYSFEKLILYLATLESEPAGWEEPLTGINSPMPWRLKLTNCFLPSRL